jgi:hypothetical protein
MSVQCTILQGDFHAQRGSVRNLKGPHLFTCDAQFVEVSGVVMQNASDIRTLEPPGVWFL